jgi:hypothetical protein
VRPLPLHRPPPPPPLPSLFFLSHAKWMGTLRRIPPPQPLLRPHARALGILRGGCSRRATVRLAFVSLRALSITHPLSPHQIRPLPARLAAGPAPRSPRALPAAGPPESSGARREWRRRAPRTPRSVWPGSSGCTRCLTSRRVAG